MGNGNSRFNKLIYAIQFRFKPNSSRNSRSKEDYFTDQWTTRRYSHCFRSVCISATPKQHFFHSFLTSGRKNQLQCLSLISSIGEAREQQMGPVEISNHLRLQQTNIPSTSGSSSLFWDAGNDVSYRCSEDKK